MEERTLSDGLGRNSDGNTLVTATTRRQRDDCAPLRDTRRMERVDLHIRKNERKHLPYGVVILGSGKHTRLCLVLNDLS